MGVIRDFALALKETLDFGLKEMDRRAHLVAMGFNQEYVRASQELEESKRAGLALGFTQEEVDDATEEVLDVIKTTLTLRYTEAPDILRELLFQRACDRMESHARSLGKFEPQDLTPHLQRFREIVQESADAYQEAQLPRAEGSVEDTPQETDQ